MRLVILGTAGYHPSDKRQTSCFFFPELGLGFDAGTGFYRVRALLQTPAVDLYLSHAHLDHVVGLTFLFDVLYQKNVERVTIHGRPQDLAALDEHLFAQPLFPLKLPHEWKPLAEEETVSGQGRLRWFPLPHPGGSVGYRIDWPDASFAYVTDTTANPDADYVDLIQGVDLLIHECNFTDEGREWAIKTGHSWLSPVLEVAHKARVGRLILTHMNPLEDEFGPLSLEHARRVFPKTDIARDHQVVDFP